MAAPDYRRVSQILRLQRELPTVPFAYHDKGLMATIGRLSAVVQLAGGLRWRWLRDTLAWLAWFVCTWSTCSAGATACRRRST